jgi:hypothetical protein
LPVSWDFRRLSLRWWLINLAEKIWSGPWSLLADFSQPIYSENCQQRAEWKGLKKTFT